MIVIRVILSVHSEQRPRFVSLLQKDVEETRQCPGCQRMDLYEDLETENQFLLYEEWESESAFRSYRDSERFQRIANDLFPLLSAKPDSRYFSAEEVPVV